jgi:F-type H+-transporting ATPase subunit delta
LALAGEQGQWDVAWHNGKRTGGAVMSEGSVARVYASALFGAAQEAGAIDQVRSEIAQFAQALQESPQLIGSLLDPQVPGKVKQRVIEDLLEGGHLLSTNVARLMLAKGRIGAFPEMQVEFERMAAEAERLIDVEVVSAVALTPKDEQEVVTKVETATGRTVRLSKRIDEGIIGGLVLRVGDVVMDASLLARVEQLRVQMQRA